MLVQESQAIAGGRQTSELKKAVSRLTSTTTGSFYDPDSDPNADVWSATSEKKFYEKVDQCIDEHPLQAVQALEQRKTEVGSWSAGAGESTESSSESWADAEPPAPSAG